MSALRPSGTNEALAGVLDAVDVVAAVVVSAVVVVAFVFASVEVVAERGGVVPATVLVELPHPATMRTTAAS